MGRYGLQPQCGWQINTPYEIIKFEKTELTGYADYAIESPSAATATYINTGIDINIRKWFKLTKIQTFKNPIVKEIKLNLKYSITGQLQMLYYHLFFQAKTKQVLLPSSLE